MQEESQKPKSKEKGHISRVCLKCSPKIEEEEKSKSPREKRPKSIKEGL